MLPERFHHNREVGISLSLPNLKIVVPTAGNKQLKKCTAVQVYCKEDIEFNSGAGLGGPGDQWVVYAQTHLQNKYI